MRESLVLENEMRFHCPTMKPHRPLIRPAAWLCFSWALTDAVVMQIRALTDEAPTEAESDFETRRREQEHSGLSVKPEQRIHRWFELKQTR
jgi:hypothetical protein